METAYAAAAAKGSETSTPSVGTFRIVSTIRPAIR
jgi:hypothetical protein